METFSFISDVLGLLLGLFDTGAIIYAIVKYRKGRSYKRVALSIGSFWIRRKDFNVQAVTNVVSFNFYDGGHVPDPIRAEIIKVTNPIVKDIVKYDNAE